MGKKLVEFFEKANQIGGLKAKMRLAMITGVPSSQADKINDTEELIKTFEKGFEEILKEFK